MKVRVLAEKIVELLLQGARRRLAGWQLVEHDFKYFCFHVLSFSEMRAICNLRSEPEQQDWLRDLCGEELNRHRGFLYRGRFT
jgi:hypothetical protein